MKTLQLDFFHNTIGLLPSEVIEREVKAISQAEIVLKIFKSNKYTDFTPSQIWILLGQQWPLTSIRRSITNLTKAGDLVKTSNKRAGLYGEMNFTWRLNPTHYAIPQK